MDVREKLVELIYENSPRLVEEEADILAKRLIANGVTVQEWISVKDRLPEMFVPVLVKYLDYNDGTADPSNVDTAVLLAENVWYWWEGDLADCDDEVRCTITHWMPLPQPPKGE